MNNAGACYDCGLPYEKQGIDIVFEPADWLEIFPEKCGVLCGICIARRAEKLPFVSIKARLYKRQPERFSPPDADAYGETKGRQIPTYYKLDDGVLYRWSNKHSDWVKQSISWNWRRWAKKKLKFFNAESEAKYAHIMRL